MQNIYTIGEVVYDIIFKEGIPLRANAGGAMLNTAVTLGRVGTEVFFVGETGTDKTASIITSFLDENNVSTKFIERYTGRNTTVALAFLDANNDAQYVFHKDYPPQRLMNPLPSPGMGDLVLFGSSFAISPVVRPRLVAFLKQARENGAMIMYDPNFRKPREEMHTILPLIEENISLSNVVRGSDEDFRNIFGTDDTCKIFDIVKKQGCNNLVITRNKEGVVVKTDNVETSVPSRLIEPVSTIGAGDNFNAGLLYGFCTMGITPIIIDEIDAKIWSSLLETGIDFASHVCMSMDNYVSQEFARGVFYKRMV